MVRRARAAGDVDLATLSATAGIVAGQPTAAIRSAGHQITRRVCARTIAHDRGRRSAYLAVVSRPWPRRRLAAGGDLAPNPSPRADLSSGARPRARDRPLLVRFPQWTARNARSAASAAGAREVRREDARFIAWQAHAQGEYVGHAGTAHVGEYRLRVDDQLDMLYRITRDETRLPWTASTWAMPSASNRSPTRI